jgi:Zn-dependent protease with chaperone function
MLIVVVSLLLGVSSILAWKKYSKPWMLYAHLLFVLSPLFYFALSINCSLGVVQGLLSWCTALFAKFVLYIVPPLMAILFIGGYFLLPKLYRVLSKPLQLRIFNKLCRLTGISAELFLVDKAKPVAFTMGKRIFVSVGMFEMLSGRELEAVLLHELHHVKSNSSWGKFSASFVRIFSPVAWFSASSVEKEECAADAFAARVQKTGRFVSSAKKKVGVF